MTDLISGEQYFEQLWQMAESIIWSDDTRPSVVLVHGYLIGTLAQTEILECAAHALMMPWSFDMRVALVLHAITEEP
jgi:hypothetical protein